MSVTDTATSGGRIVRRRRGRALEDAIFAAVVNLLQNVGYADLTMEGVAHLAATGKAALYRRWPDKEALVVDTLDHLLPSPEDLPDQGNLRDDLLALLLDKAATLNSAVGRAMQCLLAEIERDRPLLRLIDERVFAPRQQMFDVVLARSRARGEIRIGPMSPLVAEVGPALLMQRFLGNEAPLPDEFIEAIVDDVILPLVRA